MKKIFTCFIAAIFAFPLFAQNSLHYLSSTTGAACYDILYYNNYIFAGTGNTLQVFKIDSVTRLPNQKVFEHRFGSNIDDMEMKGSKLFVAANHAGISMWDASNPAALDSLDQYVPDSLNEAAYNLAFYGDSVFVAYKTKMAVFKDNGSTLSLLSKFAYQPGSSIIRGCAVKGNLLAFTSSMGTNAQKGVTLYNVATLQFISFFHQAYCDPENVCFGQNTNLLHVLGGTASYTNAADGKGLFYSLDISTPSSPVEVFRDTLPGIAGLSIAQPMNSDNVNDTIFVSAQEALDTNWNIFQGDTAAGMIYVYDATSASNVHFLTTLNGGLWNFDCDVVGKTVYVASEWYGIKTIDITNIHNDYTLGYTPTGGWNIGADKFGNRLLVADEGYGFKQYDVTNLQQPVYQMSNRDPGFCMNLKYAPNGNYVYGFYLTGDHFRVMDPANNYNVVGHITPVVGSNDVWVYQNKIVSLDLPSVGSKTLYVTDVSNPAAPFIDTTMVINDITDVLVNASGKVFVSRWDSIKVFDLNNNMAMLTGVRVPSPFVNNYEEIAEYKDTIYVYVSGFSSPGIYKYYYNGSNQLTLLSNYTNVSIASPGKMLMAADSFGLYVSGINEGLFAYDKNTMTQTGYYRHSMEFTVNFLWGPQELFCKDGIIFLPEYFGQTTMLTTDPNLTTTTNDPENEMRQNQLSIFPVPAKNEVSICTGENTVGTLEIFDATGKLILSEKFSGNCLQLDMQNLDDGIYFTRVTSGKNSRAGKLVVQH